MRLAAITLLFWCLSLQAAVYYVDPATGNNANAGTSTGTAWASLPGTVGATGAGWVVLQNGDTVVVKGGSVNNCQVQFKGANYNGAAAFNSILVQSGHLFTPAWGTGRAVFDQQNTRTWGFALGESGTTPLLGVTLDGFEVANIAAGAAGAPWDVTTGSSCILFGGNNAVGWCSIKRCNLHDAARTVDNTGHGLEGAAGVTNFLVYYNTVGPNIGTKGIETYGFVNGAVSNNCISGTGDHSISLTRCTNLDVCNNLIAQAGQQVHEPTYCISVSAALHCDVWNNVLFDSQTTRPGFEWSGGIGIYDPGNPDITTSNRFLNNTLYRLSQINNGGNSSAIRVGNSFMVGVQEFLNNLVVNCTNAVGPDAFMVYTGTSSNTVFGFNSFWGGFAGLTLCGYNDGTYHYSTVGSFSQASVTFTNNQQVDPVFTGGTLPTGLDASFHPNTGFFALSASSPSAVTVTANALAGNATYGFSHATDKFSKDIIGNPRSAWSMGAYEYTSGGTAPSITGQTIGFSGSGWGVK